VILGGESILCKLAIIFRHTRGAFWCVHKIIGVGKLFVELKTAVTIAYHLLNSVKTSLQ
jgi:hypothetical protein